MTQEQGFEQLVNQWHDLTVQTWGSAARQVVESDSYVGWMNASMDWYLAGLKRTRQAVKLSLEALDLPSGEDLARLSSQILGSETRVVECEEQIDTLAARLAALEKRHAELEKKLASSISTVTKKGGTHKS